MKKAVYLMILVVSVLSVILAAAGCGGGSETTTTATTAPTTAPTTTTTTPPTTATTSPPTGTANVVEVAITAEGFVPATITVPVGTKVTWFNQDDRRHWVTPTSDSKFKTPDTGSIGTGARLSQTLTEPGEYPYTDFVVPAWRGLIIVQ